MRPSSHTGQGTVEYIGLVLVLAVGMVASLAVVRHLRPDGAPPRAAIAAVERVTLPGLLGRRQASGGRSLVRRLLPTARTLLAGRRAFLAGFARAVRDDVRALLRDPRVALTGGGGRIAALLRDPIGTVRAAIDDGETYIRDLRAMPLREAYVRVMGDAGALAEDILVNRGKRRLIEIGRDRRRGRDRGDEKRDGN